MYTLVDGVEFYDKDEVDDIVRAITGGSLPNEDGIRNELTTKIDAEAAEREQADIKLSAELGARIDEETVARETATAANKSLIDIEAQSRVAVDTLLSNQLAAIEQLHTTLIGPNGFVDSDGDTVKANDSGKSIRQIAHEEFYRQLITDADDVKTQLDTLKELADYLQRNPSVLTDMYSKLGITWSVDNPTDFGTFDFSTVLTATNVDDAVLELYNTFNSKIGDLQQLSTTFKGSVVGAINELDSTIRSKTYTDVKTIVFTPASPDVPPAELNSTTKHFAASTTATFAEVYARLSDDKQSAIAVLEIDKYNKIYASVLQITDTSITFCSTSCITKATDGSAVNAYQDTTINWFNDGSVDVIVTDDYVAARIDEEVTAREQADTALGTRIDEEVTAREQADTALGTRIDEEVAAREQADTALGTRIDEEVTAREQADTALGTRIGQLDNLKTIVKSSTVAAINELYDTVQQGGGDSPVPSVPVDADPYALKEYIDDPYIHDDDDWYDLVIDSDEALAQWRDASNIALKSGPSRVKIKKGTWTCTGVYDPDHAYQQVSSALVFLECVHAEPGAKLILKGFLYSLYDNSVYLGASDTPNFNIHDAPARYIRNLALEIQPRITYAGCYVYGMHNCSMHITSDYHRAIDDTSLPMCAYVLHSSHYNCINKTQASPVIAMSYHDANVYKLNVHIQDCITLYCVIGDNIVSCTNISISAPAYAFSASGKEQFIAVDCSIAHNTRVAITVTDSYTGIFEALPDFDGAMATHGFMPIIINGITAATATYCTVNITAKSNDPRIDSATRYFRQLVAPICSAFIPKTGYVYTNNTAIFTHCSAYIDINDRDTLFTTGHTAFVSTLYGFGAYGSSSKLPTILTDCTATIYATRSNLPASTSGELASRIIGFSNVTNLYNCKAYMYGYNPSYTPSLSESLHPVFGFNTCDNVTNCVAMLRMCAAAPDSAGFIACTGMLKCASNSKWIVTGKYDDIAHPPTSVLPFNTANCCANIGSYVADTAAAPTVAGGYNVDIGAI